MQKTVSNIYEIIDPLNGHFLIAGKNGSGMSGGLLQIVKGMLENWVNLTASSDGFTLVDPYGDNLTIVVNILLHMEYKGADIQWGKVHYIAKADPRPLQTELESWLDGGHVILWGRGFSEQDAKMYHKIVSADDISSNASHVLIVDNVFFAPWQVLTQMLMEDRKYNLTIGLAPHFLDDIDESLLRTIFDNIQTFISFGLSRSSIVAASKMVSDVSEETFQNLKMLEFVYSTPQGFHYEPERVEPIRLHLPNGEAVDCRDFQGIHEAIEYAHEKLMELTV